VGPLRLSIALTMHEQVRSGWQSAVAEALPKLLAGLRQELNPLLTAARNACTALGGLPMEDATAVAGATSAQRNALLELGPLAARYERLRLAQLAAMAACGVGVPGVGGSDASRLPGDETWQEYVGRQLHEFRQPDGGHTEPTGLAGPVRLCRVAQRKDVWLPDREELERAHAALFGRRVSA